MDWRTYRLVMAPWCLAFVLCSTGARGEETAPDILSLMAEAQHAEDADMRAWHRYEFHRRAERYKLDATGGETDSEILDFRNTPTEKGFDEALLLIDGREPTPDEVAHHRRQARFTKHYDTMISGAPSEDPDGGGYSLHDLLFLPSYRYVGREMIDDTECHRVDFSPDPGRST